MAKQKTTQKPPSIEDVQQIENVQSETVVETIETDIAQISVPVGVIAAGYVSNRCDVKALSRQQRTALRKIQNGLVSQEAKLENGKFVRNGADAIKWMLERV